MTLYQFNVLLCDSSVLCSKFKGSVSETRGFLARQKTQVETLAEVLSGAVVAGLGIGSPDKG